MNRRVLPLILLMALALAVQAQEPLTGIREEDNGTHEEGNGIQEEDNGTQEETPGTEGKDWLSAGGYATWLHTAMFEDPADDWVNSSMLHNRLNFKAYAGSNITFAMEIRNRFVTGDMVRLDPTYVPGLSADPGWADLSWNISKGNSYVLNMMIDRAYVDLTVGNFQVRAGRQRINWSQALIWNPNDIFNTYSFFDFDYVERPGSDAIRVTWSTGPSSSVEAAVKVDGSNRITAAALGRFTLMSTDLQFLAGVTDDEYFTAGTGLSGAIGSVSVRGEATFFAPLDGAGGEENNFTATLGIDKAFSDKVTTLVQAMYSSNPVELSSFSGLYGGGLTARQLAFSEFSAAAQVAWTPLPLLSISLAAIWFPDLDGYYAGPSLDYSLAENTDFSLVWQHFNSTISGLETKLNLGFLRIRHSF